MKFNCGPDWWERHKLSKLWHRWFAWFPVRIGERKCVWLEFIERKHEGYGMHEKWRYRPCA
jgi:hypothetical protein